MVRLFHDVNIDWLGKRRFFIGLSIMLLLAGMGMALYRHKFHPGGSDAFNLGVGFKGGTVVTVRFKQPPSVDQLRSAINTAGHWGAAFLPRFGKPGMFPVTCPHQGSEEVRS